MLKEYRLVLLLMYAAAAAVHEGVDAQAEDPLSVSNDNDGVESESIEANPDPEWKPDLRATCGGNRYPCKNLKTTVIKNTTLQYFSCSATGLCGPGKQVDGTPKDIQTCVGIDGACVPCKRYGQTCDPDVNLCCAFYVDIPGKNQGYVDGGKCTNAKCASPCWQRGQVRSYLKPNEAIVPNCDPTLGIPCCKSEDTCLAVSIDPPKYQCLPQNNVCLLDKQIRYHCPSTISDRDAHVYGLTTFCSCGPQTNQVSLCNGTSCVPCAVAGKSCTTSENCCKVFHFYADTVQNSCNNGKCEICTLNRLVKSSDPMSCKNIKPCCDKTKICVLSNRYNTEFAQCK